MIKLFAMDVDGTLTDGGIYIDDAGNETKRFDAKDGQGIAQLLSRGVKVAFISGRFSRPTERRAEGLKITRCINGSADKINDLTALAKEFNIERSEVAYAGDDAPDVECIKWAGLGIAVANAHESALFAADYVTKKKAGRGAIRECCDRITKINNGESL